MSINNIIQGLAQFFAKTPEFTPVEAELQSLAQIDLKAGQQVQVEILANLPNHRALARIAGELLKMELPMNVQPGETYAMTFIGEEPRLTFALSRSANSPLPVNISDTGKLLAMLSGNGSPQQAEALPRMNMILNGPPLDTPLLAARLREALVFSGLFYESHLVQWAMGERTMRELLREPQGKLSPKAKNTIGAEPGADSSRSGPVNTADTEKKSISDENTNKCRARGDFSNIASETVPVVRDQLQALHTGRFSWQGTVWPDQQMEWTVDERESNPDKENAREWKTTLRLHMPVLGSVKASLNLGTDGLRLHIITDSTNTAAAMMSDMDGLADALAKTGLFLAGLVVNCEQDRSEN